MTSSKILKKTDIKICIYYYHDDIVNINDLDSRNIKVDKTII